MNNLVLLFCRNTCAVTAEWYLMLLQYRILPALQERHALPVVIFVLDDVLLHIARNVKTFLLESFTEDQVISYCVRFSCPSQNHQI